MCDTCGCNITPGNKHLLAAGGKLEKTGNGREAITVLHDLLHENDHSALHNREHFNAHEVVAINLMSSPGAMLASRVSNWLARCCSTREVTLPLDFACRY